MHRPSLGWVCLVVGLGAGTPRGLSAEEPAAPSLEWRAYPVHAFLRGHPHHKGDRGPFPAPPDWVNDEANPLLGTEEEERTFTYAAITEAIRGEVGTPGTWETEGVALTLAAPRLLLVRAPRAIQGEIAAWLDRAARRDQRTAFVDVAAFRGDPDAARGEGGVAGAVARGAWVAVGAARLAVQSGGRATSRGGTLRAYLQDYDVEVAEDGNTADPIVGVLPEGLSIEAEAAPAGDDRLSVRVRGWWAAPATWAGRVTGEGDRLETPTSAGTSFEMTTTTGDGTWATIPGGSGVTLAVRAQAASLPSSDAAEGILLPAAPRAAATAGLVSRSYDLRDLGLPIVQARGTSIEAWPSNYLPPKPPALPETTPPIEMGTVLELVRQTAPLGALEREGASADVLQGLLRVRTDPEHHAQIAALLGVLREILLPTTRVRATVLALPWASIPEWWKGLPEDLLRDGAAPLRSRAGARVVATGALRLRDAERRATVSGTERSYVADFDVEIAKASAIGNPIVRSVLEGMSLDVEQDRPCLARAASIVLRLDTGRVAEMREVPTRHGAIECPVLSIGRTRGELVVPWGTTRVAAAWATGTELQLVLLTASGE